MTSAAKAPVERRERTREMIDKLLAERTQVLVKFCQVAGLEPYTPDKHKPVLARLQEFCQLLVDYSAFGHFEIYDRIANGEERRVQVLGVAEEVYPRIVETTSAAVAFNDRYDPSDHHRPHRHHHWRDERESRESRDNRRAGGPTCYHQDVGYFDCNRGSGWRR